MGEGARVGEGVGDGKVTGVGVDVESAGGDVGEATSGGTVLSGDGLAISRTGVGEASACPSGRRGPQVAIRVLNSRKKPATNPASTVPMQPHI